MNKHFLIFLTPFLIASHFKDNQYTIPTIQIFTSVKKRPALNFFKKLPKEYQEKCLILHIKKYYTIRCVTNNPKKDLKILKKFAPDSFFINTKKDLIKKKKKEKTDPNSLYLAQYFYKKGDYEKSLKLFKKAYKFNKKRQIAINISYLEGYLGKKPSIISEETLYAYSVGAISNGNTKELKKIIKKYLPISKKGYLYFIMGYLNEKNPQIALKYYKIAYEKNPTNKQFIYSLARIYDINKNYKQAIYYYNQVANCNKKICKLAKKRIRQLLE